MSKAKVQGYSPKTYDAIKRWVSRQGGALFHEDGKPTPPHLTQDEFRKLPRRVAVDRFNAARAANIANRRSQRLSGKGAQVTTLVENQR